MRAEDVDAAGLQDDLALVAIAGIQIVHAVEAAQQRALAAAGRADQGRDGPLGNRQVDVLEGLPLAVIEADVADLGLERRRPAA